MVTYDGEIEPEDLIPEYISTKGKLLEFSRGPTPPDGSDEAMEAAKLEAKIRKIEGDVLFDKYAAEMQWKNQKIIVERQLAAAKREAQETVEEAKPTEPEATAAQAKTAGDDVNEEAEKIAAEILAQQDSDDDDLGGLFDSLPQNEVDPTTGKTQTVINSADGVKLILKDFGKWSGVSPRRVLEETCRSR